jgi:hypothetical protein
MRRSTQRRQAVRKALVFLARESARPLRTASAIAAVRSGLVVSAMWGIIRAMILPGWVTDNATSLRDEAAPYVGLVPEEKAIMLAAACRAGARLLRARADAANILARTDALPASSERALERLRTLQSKLSHAGTE